jgi:hypothetical protein
MPAAAHSVDPGRRQAFHPDSALGNASQAMTDFFDLNDSLDDMPADV